MAPVDQTFDNLSLLLGDDDAKGILEALAAIEDGSHQRACRNASFVELESSTYGPPRPPVDQEHHQPLAVTKPQEDSKPPATTEYKKPCHPYFYYRDFSTLPDPDPATPITAPGRIPNFPAKMYAILSRKDLSDIITWMPHGRSWKVLKPREFEVKVIPTYFEHSKFSSFIRQANGWGFRRIISKGADRNSYYHELFLRGRPHLIKLMRRPPPSSKPLADASTEPDFCAVSAERPLPEIKEGDATELSQNFPRQATYSFVPPASHQSQPATQQVTNQNYQPDHQCQQAPNAMHRQAGGPVDVAPTQSYYSESSMEPSNVFNVPVQQHQQHQPVQHYEYHPQQQQYQPQDVTNAHADLEFDAPVHEEVLSSMRQFMHSVESTDSLLDLIKQPLPCTERFGPHTFISLFD